MKNKQPKIPPPYAAEVKDHRHAGTFEVLVPVPNRNKPVKAPPSFQTLQAAENWIHSPEGKEFISDTLKQAQKG